MIIIINNNIFSENFKNDVSSSYPLTDIINTDFEKLIYKRNILNNYLPQMINQNLDNTIFKDNSNLKLVISKYQNILKYLSQVEENQKKFNNILKQSNKEILSPNEKIKEREKEINKKLDENESKIFYLEKKINIFKKIIILSENKLKRKPLYSFVLDIHDENYNYYCDICPDIKFNSYKEVQLHYLNEHKNILKIRERNNSKLNDISVNNLNYEKFYFDTKLDIIKDELKYLIFEMNQKKSQEDYNNKNMDKLKKDVKRLTSQSNKNINTKNMSSKTLNYESIEENNDINDLEEIYNNLNNFERLQKNNNDNLQKNFDNFKKEIFLNLQNLKNKKPIVFSNTINYK